MCIYIHISFSLSLSRISFSFKLIQLIIPPSPNRDNNPGSGPNGRIVCLSKARLKFN